MVKQQHLDYRLSALLKPNDVALVRVVDQGQSLRAQGLGAPLAVPLLDLLLPVNKAAQYAHLGNFHMAEINLRLLKKEVI